MKLSMTLSYAASGARGFRRAAQRVAELERAGLDQVWIPEAYSFDAISQVGYLAAVTDRIEIGTGIVNVYSRTPALMAMTAAGCDFVSDGRFNLGLGASGPQVIEGFHGVAYERPMLRTREYIEACRAIWRRDTPFEYHGETIDVPLPAAQGTGLGRPLKIINHPVRSSIPIWWASLMPRSVQATAEVADGWMPTLFVPERADRVWGDALRAGAARRDPALEPLQVVSGGMLAIGDELVGAARAEVLERQRPTIALYVGGMGARGRNFYNDVFSACGYEREAAQIQDLYLDGRKEEAAAAVPADFLERTNLVGPRDVVAERVEAFRAAGVSSLQIEPVGHDRLRDVEALRSIVDGR